MDHIFVYGSLRQGQPGEPARRLARQAHYRGRASIGGRLYKIDWYPGLTDPAHDVDRVIGDVFAFSDANLLDWLDRYEEVSPTNDESGEYRRVRRAAYLLNAPPYASAAIETWTYLFNGRPPERDRVQSGDWTRR